MRIEKHLLNKPIFDVKDIQKYIPNKQTAKNTLVRLQKEGKIIKIRNNMYSCSKDGQIIANPYQIASAINKTSYVSHLSAINYFNQQEIKNSVVYVGTLERFDDFKFQGITYICIVVKTLAGIEKGKQRGIKVACIERTLIDLIKDIDKRVTYQEIKSIINKQIDIDFKKMKKILVNYNNQFLCQKIGYLFNDYQDKACDQLKAYCISKIGDSKRYITKDISSKKYNHDWNLIVPINEMKNK